eukprot:scaffold28233_cov21-Tisochrysis_lutea.AAC.7
MTACASVKGRTAWQLQWFVKQMYANKAARALERKSTQLGSCSGLWHHTDRESKPGCRAFEGGRRGLYNFKADPVL